MVVWCLLLTVVVLCGFFFFKQKTAYEMRISDWSSDVCSSDLAVVVPALPVDAPMPRGHDLDALLAAVTPDTRLLLLANPNNPTGTWFSHAALASFMTAVPDDVVVVVDEAYGESADAPDFGSALALLPAHPNLVVTRTFSKAYALAGLRVGYAVGHAELVAVLERVRESFNVNGVALAAAEAALADDAPPCTPCPQHARTPEAPPPSAEER